MSCLGGWSEWVVRNGRGFESPCNLKSAFTTSRLFIPVFIGCILPLRQSLAILIAGRLRGAYLRIRSNRRLMVPRSRSVPSGSARGLIFTSLYKLDIDTCGMPPQPGVFNMRCAYSTNPGLPCIQPLVTVLVQVECKVGSSRHLRSTTAHTIPVVQQTLTLLLVVSCKQITRWMMPSGNANEKKSQGGWVGRWVNIGMSACFPPFFLPLDLLQHQNTH